MMDEPGSALAVLEDSRASLSELISALSELETQSNWTSTQSIGITSNVTLNLMDVFLRRHAYLHGVDIKVHMGGYDDYINDIETFSDAGVEQLLLFSFFDNLMPSFEAQIQHIPTELIQAKQLEYLARLGVALDAAKQFKTVFLTKFHRYTFPAPGVPDDKIERIIGQFNDALEALVADRANVMLLDLGASIANIGYQCAFDDRFYSKAKAPYTTRALNEMARDLLVATKGFGSSYYKAIVLDCDGTLWGGLVGEDLVAGIKLDPYDAPGSVFWRVQHEILALEKRGVLICLCSKNNPEDVQEVFEKHPHMLLKQKHITLMKVNWNDKVSNLKEIAQELNIGLDSLVFIDDSNFECQLVRDQLPAVKTIMVPKLLSDYSRVFQEVGRLFGTSTPLQEGQSRTELYKMRSATSFEGSKFDTHEDYLRSLDLEVNISRDDVAAIPRISELSLKSNQFNLTTQRYSEGDIERMIQAGEYAVYSFSLKDKFGSHGIIGILIAKHESARLKIDTFLMSCRVIGRGAEFSVWNHVFEDARKRGCTHVDASYIPTSKNIQVKDFYERLGLETVSEDKNNIKFYSTELAKMKAIRNDWMKVFYD